MAMIRLWFQASNLKWIAIIFSHNIFFFLHVRLFAGLGILLVFLSDGMFIITLLLNVFSSETQKSV